MTAAQPVGQALPHDGVLPANVFDRAVGRPLSIYVHVPFCASRCGYCDFNTYTPSQLGGYGVADYLASVHAEIALARQILPHQYPISTVFFGGGTPSVLSASQLAEILEDLRTTFGLAWDVEITTEANPESVDEEWCARLVQAGFTRLSLGMQSSRRHVLAVLDRVHTPGRALEVAALARREGFGQISLDLIYGTPGESLDDWKASLDAVLGVRPDHVSAYALIVEDGTALARRVKQGELAAPDDDELADRYLLAEQRFTASGLVNYEISNWSTGKATRARHNLAYWLGHDWWGIGPGAHSHVDGVRWWNRKHPQAWSGMLAEGHSPAQSQEVLDDEQRRIERILLELRIAEGVPLEILTSSERERVPGFVERGLVTVDENHLVLTVDGRLLADAITRELVD